MKLLAIETSTAALSVALQVDQQIFARHELVPRQHAKLILPWINDLFAKAKIELSQLDAIAVGSGPGGFTGIRVGMSVAQGIALINDTPIIPVSSLRALAQTVMDESSQPKIIVVQDAKMKQVYYAAYIADENGLAKVEVDDQLCDPDNVVQPNGNEWLVVGDACSVYPELNNLLKDFKFNDAHCPNAKSILKIASELYQQGDFVSPDEALPTYLRDKTAWKKHPASLKK